MWDLKLQTIDYFFFLNYFYYNQIFFFFNFIDPTLYNGLIIFNWKIFYQFAQNITIFFAIKFLLAIMLLILIRGGTPRYRYDYLTKLGWLKFIGFIVLGFFFSLLFFYLY